MAISVDTIRRLTEFVWLDACSLTSSGLYEGKAGHALCLFEMARYFRDDALEERAFGCLQEALVCRAEAVDCGFGLSGIGSVFLYLIRYSFVENDFQSLFGGQQKKIYAAIGQAGDKAGFIELLPFLTACRWLDPADAEPARLSAAILNDSFGSVEKTFAPDRWHCEGEKEHWLSFLGTLLRSMFVLERQGAAAAAGCDEFLHWQSPPVERFRGGAADRYRSGCFCYFGSGGSHPVECVAIVAGRGVFVGRQSAGRAVGCGGGTDVDVSDRAQPADGEFLWGDSAFPALLFVCPGGGQGRRLEPVVLFIGVGDDGRIQRIFIGYDPGRQHKRRG